MRVPSPRRAEPSTTNPSQRSPASSHARRSAAEPRGGTTRNSGRAAARAAASSPSMTPRHASGVHDEPPHDDGEAGDVGRERRDCRGDLLPRRVGIADSPRHRAGRGSSRRTHGRGRAARPRRRRSCRPVDRRRRALSDAPSRSSRPSRLGVADDRPDLDEAAAEARQRAGGAQAGIEAAAEPHAGREDEAGDRHRKAVGRPHVSEQIDQAAGRARPIRGRPWSRATDPARSAPGARTAAAAGPSGTTSRASRLSLAVGPCERTRESPREQSSASATTAPFVAVEARRGGAVCHLEPTTHHEQGRHFAPKREGCRRRRDSRP